MSGNNGRTIILQERDRHLLRELAVMRVIDREQAKVVAGFGSTTRANARLLLLTRARFLRRYFLGTVGGTRKSLYILSEKGAEVVSVTYRGPRRMSGEILPVDFFALHQLEVNELYCLLKYQPIPLDGVRLERWESFYEPIAPATELIPDGYAEIGTPQRLIATFVEVDRGNEKRATWERKLQAYIAYALSTNFTKRFGRDQFRVAVIAPERRTAWLRKTTARITEKIFWFTSREAILSEGFWSPIWQRPSGDARSSFIS